MAKRGYSRAFTPRTDRRVRVEVDRIPPTLLADVQAKARREGLSMRALTLHLWSAWLSGELVLPKDEALNEAPTP